MDASCFVHILALIEPYVYLGSNIIIPKDDRFK